MLEFRFVIIMSTTSPCSASTSSMHLITTLPPSSQRQHHLSSPQPHAASASTHAPRPGKPKHHDPTFPLSPSQWLSTASAPSQQPEQASVARAPPSRNQRPFSSTLGAA